MSEQTQTSPKRQIGLAEIVQAIGLFAGTATLVYVGGGAILSLRLHAKGFESEAVVSNLPREFLISIGLTEIVVPLAIAGSIVIAVLFPLVRLSNIEFAAQALGDWTHATRTQRVSLVGAILASTIAGLAAAGLAFDWSGLALPLVLATAAVFWSLGAAIRIRFVDRLASFGAVVSTGVLIAVCFTPWLVAGAQRRHALLDSTACLVDSQRIDGYLIGETADQVYIGEPRRRGARTALIVSLPRSRVQGLFIGSFFDCARWQAARHRRPA